MESQQETENNIELDEEQVDVTKLTKTDELDNDAWRMSIEAYEQTLRLTEETALNNRPKSLTSLLRRLGFIEINLSQAQVNLPALEDLMSQHPFGKAWSLFLTVSLLKMALFFPCVSMRDIKPLSKNDSLFQVGESDEQEILSVKPEDTAPRVTQSSSSCFRPLLLTSALVLESQVALRKVSAIKSFQETLQVLIDGTWGLFASSLIINALVNLILYPEAYAQEDKALYLLSLPLIIGDYLRNALPNPTVYLSLLTIPLGLGLINALFSAFRIPLTQDHSKQIQDLLQHLKLHNKGFWRDLGGWFLSKTLPDAFPVVGLCALIPQVRIQRALERITFALIWDGRLSGQERTTLFHYVREFVRRSRHLTQLQAISVLADVQLGVTVSRLQTLQQAGVEEDTLKALLFIKTESFRELRYLASTYYLPQETNQNHLPRYVRANYDLWRLGYPQHHGLQPLFLFYQGGRLVLSVFLYVSVGYALVAIFQCLAEGKQWTFIQEEGGYICNMCADLPIFYRDTFTVEDCFSGYMVIPRSAEGLFSFIDRFDLSTVTSFDLSNQPALLSNSTTLSRFLTRLKPKMVSLTIFDLDKFNAGNEAEQTAVLKHVMAFLDGSSVDRVYLIDTPLTQAALDALASILPNTGMRLLSLLQITNHVSPFFFNDTSTFAQGLLLSNVSLLFLDTNPLGDAGLRPIASILPKSKIQTLSIEYTKITVEGCIFLAEKIMETPRFYYLNIGHNSQTGNGINDGCGFALAKALSHIDSELIMDNLLITDEEVGAFANALSATPPPLLEKLGIGVFTLFKDNEAANFSKLIQAIPRSRLTRFYLNPVRVLVPQYNYRISIFPDLIENGELTEALSRSNVTDFGWSAACYYNIIDNICPEVCVEGNLAVYHFLYYTQYFVLRKIKHLELSCTGVDAVIMGFLELLLTLVENSIESLNLDYNPIKTGIVAMGNVISNRTDFSKISLTGSQIDNKGFLNFANHINQSKLRDLNLAINFLGDQAMISLFEGIQGSSMEIVAVSYNNITAQGAQSIANLLIQDTPSLPGLWVDLLDTSKHLASVEQANNLIEWRIALNPIGDEGATALCQVLPQTRINYAGSINDFASGSVSQPVIAQCGVISSAKTLQPPLPFMFFRLPSVLWEWVVPQQGHPVQPTKIIENRMVIFHQQPVSDETALQATIPMTHHETIIQMQLYDNLLTLCQTFLQSAGQAAALAAFVPLVTDVLHRFGGYELDKARTISQGLQVSLLFAFSNSKTALTAGFVAHILVSQLTRSPQVIASVTVGTSLVTTIVETALTQSVLFPWVALQMGVGLMGAAVGSRGFQQVSKVGKWGMDKAQCMMAWFFSNDA